MNYFLKTFRPISLKGLFFLLFFQLCLASAETPYPETQLSCSFDSLTENCNYFLNQPEYLTDGYGGKVINLPHRLKKLNIKAEAEKSKNKSSDSEPSKIPPPEPPNFSAEEKGRLQKIFDAALERVKDVILSGRKETELDPNDNEDQNILNALARLKLITLADVNSESVYKHQICLLAINYNAGFSKKDMSVKVCPSSALLPARDLFFIIAHEIGHSLNPCKLQSPVLSVDHKELKENRKKIADFIDKHPEYDLYVIRGQLEESGETTNESIFDQPGGRKFIEYLESIGVVKTLVTARKINLKTESTSGDYLDGYLFSDVAQCLGSKSGGGFKFQNTSMLKSFFKDPKSDPSYLFGETRHDQANSVIQNPECQPTVIHSETDETLSDWIGAQALNLQMRSEKNVDDKEKIIPRPKINSSTFRTSGFSSFAVLQCALDMIDEDHSEDDRHADTRKRLNDILLRMPELRSELGCTPKVGPPVCTHNPKWQPKDSRHIQPGEVIQ